MKKWLDPPLIKCYEAFSAVGDQRVELRVAGHARVWSSSRDKVYDVYYSTDRRQFSANDNGTYWRRYVGYPIIATLIALDELYVEPEVLTALARTPWKQLNEELANDYEAAIKIALGKLPEVIASQCTVAAERIEREIAQLSLMEFPEHSFSSPARSIRQAGR
jgi:hypothetical protein